MCPTSDAVFKTSTSKYFLGEGRSTSPFGEKGEKFVGSESN